MLVELAQGRPLQKIIELADLGSSVLQRVEWHIEDAVPRTKEDQEILMRAFFSKELVEVLFKVDPLDEDSRLLAAMVIVMEIRRPSSAGFLQFILKSVGQPTLIESEEDED